MLPLLEKTRENLPQKAAPASVAKPAAVARPASAVVKTVDVDEDDRPSTAPARTTTTKGKSKAGGATAAKKVMTWFAALVHIGLFCHG